MTCYPHSINNKGVTYMEYEYLSLDDLDTKGKTVILRIDINSTIDLDNQEIRGRERYRQIVPTINELDNCKLVLLAHQSRPGNEDCTKLGLHRKVLQEVLGREVKYAEDLIGSEARRAVKELNDGEILLLENTRLYAEETALKNQPPEIARNSYIVQNLAPLADIFVIDSFAAAHRAQPSLVGFMDILPSAAGRLMEREISALNKTFSQDRRPVAVILGGAKIEESIAVANNLLTSEKADKILVTGLVGHVFFLANGIKLGSVNMKVLNKKVKDLDKYVDLARDLIYKHPYNIFMPDIVAVDNKGSREEVYIDMLPTEHMIKDIGEGAADLFIDEIMNCSTVILNGPAGVFEEEQFAFGTEKIFRAACDEKLYSVAGGGETTTALDKFSLKEKINHVSTGGGATMTFLAGREMPVLKYLSLSKEKFS